MIKKFPVDKFPPDTLPYRHHCEWHLVWSILLRKRLDERLARYLGNALKLEFRSLVFGTEWALAERLIQEENGQMLLLVVKQGLPLDLNSEFALICYADSTRKSCRATELEEQAHRALENFNRKSNES